MAFITPIVFDFYNYSTDKPEFISTFSKFVQVSCHPVPRLIRVLYFESLSNFSFSLQCWVAESGTLRGTAILPGDEMLEPEKVSEEEECQDQDQLGAMLMRYFRVSNLSNNSSLSIG